MANEPWLKYQDQGSDGPWTKYQSPPAEPEKKEKPLGTEHGNPILGAVQSAIGEPLMQNVTGLAGSVAGGLRGIYDVATGKGTEKAAQDVQSTQQAMTYQPRTQIGEAASKVVNYPFEKLAQGADYVGGKVSEKTGSPLLGAAANTAIQAVPALLARKTGVEAPVKDASKATETAKAAEAQAKDYVSSSTHLDWADLSDKVKKTLTDMASSSRDLSKLDPKAIERQSRLDKLGIPATKGQVTRDLGQLTLEENLTKSDAGKPIRDISAAQDQRLHDLVDTLRKDTGAKADTRQAVGKSIQEAARSKMASLKSDYQAKYKAAREQGSMQEPADISPLNEWLKNPTNRRNATYLEKAIKDYEQDGKISINDLEEVRKELNAHSKTPGSNQHFAGEAKAVIDEILDKSGGDTYQQARASYKAVQDEFSRQGRIKKLVSQKGYSSDRAVALEDTFDDVVLRGSSEDLVKLKASLTEGGTMATRTKGTQAWKDLQGATLDFLKEKAAGKRAITGEKEQLQFNSSFRDAFSELQKDGKIDLLFSPEQAKMLREIYQAVGDVRTKPAGRIAGSDTTPRILAMLDKVSHLPGGTFATGAARLAKKVYDAGKESRQATEATNPDLSKTVPKQATLQDY